MRIDLAGSSLPQLEHSTGPAGTATGDSAARAAAQSDEDVAQFTTGGDAVATLKAQLNSVPEVRQDRVDALRQAVNTGTFQISPTRIANALLSDA